MSIAPPPIKTKKSFRGKPEAVAILIAGVLGAIGVIVAALIGSDVINVSVAPPTATTPSPAATAASTITPSPSQSPEPTSPPPTSATPTSSATTNPKSGPFDCEALKRGTLKVRHCGDAVLVSGHYINLDSTAKDWSVNSSVGIPLIYYASQFIYDDRGNRRISKAPSKTPPRYSTCTDVDRRYVSTLDVLNFNKNSMFCAKTPMGRYGAIRMTKSWYDNDEIALSIVVWEKRS